MAIPQSQYVQINSAVAGGSQVLGREFMARLFTDNPLMPPQTYAQFPNAASVGAYFGVNSEEYKRATFYFNYISKAGTSPGNISFARWVDEAVAPMVFGFVDAVPQNYASMYEPISDAAIALTVGGVFHNFSGIDLTSAVNLAGVASALQTAIAVTFASATVVYSPTTANFIISSGVVGSDPTFAVSAGTGGTDVASLMNLIPVASVANGRFVPQPGVAATLANGSAVETPVQSITTSANLSNNFGSFSFMPKQLSLTLTAASATIPVSDTAALSVGMAVEGVGIPFGAVIFSISTNTNIVLGQAASPSTPVPATVSGAQTISFFLSLAQAVALANWTKAEDVTFIYQLSVNSGNATVWQAGLAGIAGTGINLKAGLDATQVGGTTPGYIEMLPEAIQASVNYSGQNTVVNYEFTQYAGLAASVSDLTTALTYNLISINYNGQTQTAGQLINFYQQGVLQGLITDPTDMTTYANEIWLKDAMGASLMNLLLNVNQVPANNNGRTMIFATMQGVINQALVNGTISVGKTLTPSQIVAIGSITNDPDAWYQVQNQGYWRDVIFVPQATTPVTYQAVYTLVYSKDDVIRKVVGNDFLI